MSENKSVAPSLAGLSNTLLLIALLTFKLTGLVDWSWWLILAPLWAPAVIVIVGLAIVVVWGVLAVILE